MKRFISSTLKYNQDKISWVAIVIIVSSVMFSNLTYANKFPNGLESLRDSNLGGPLDASLESLGIISANGVLGTPADEAEETAPITESSNVIVGLNAPEGYSIAGSIPVIREYTVQEEDTIESVAKKFGISTETLAISNQLSDLKGDLSTGSTLTILPIDGIQVKLKDEESLEDIAKRYQVAVSDISEYNNIDENNVSSGQTLIVPDAVVPNTEKPFYVAPNPATTKVATSSISSAPKSVTLPVTSGYFGYPTTGYNYGVIHSTNGVDISNSCGTPIYASAEGTVTTSQDGWNGGYGSYIKITHPNGVVTLYGHLSQRNSQVGNQVAKGQLIGLMGTTGRSTGCHLHFEVRGATNPLAR